MNGTSDRSKMWSCPRDCGFHVVDGPVPDGEPTTDDLIAQHLDEHDERDARPTPDIPYLLWSNKHPMWWRPDSSGYTEHIAAAGRYSEADALERVLNSAQCGRLDQVTCMVAAPENWSATKAASLRSGASVAAAGQIAAALRRIADAVEPLDLPDMWVMLDIQPHGWGSERPAVVDRVAVAVLGTPGAPIEMSGGSWQHSVSGSVGAVGVAVYCGIPDHERAELERLRARVAELESRS